VPSLNKVILVGNLTRDPELRFIPSGQAVANLRLATNRRWKASNGEWKEDTCFVGVVVWGKDAESCAERVKKGSPVLVEGRLQNRSWQADDGQKRSILEVVSERIQFLQPRKEDAAFTGDDPAGDEDIYF
jgi:single-strand DNA-binding protein